MSLVGSFNNAEVTKGWTGCSQDRLLGGFCGWKGQEVGTSVVAFSSSTFQEKCFLYLYNILLEPGPENPFYSPSKSTLNYRDRRKESNSSKFAHCLQLRFALLKFWVSLFFLLFDSAGDWIHVPVNSGKYSAIKLCSQYSNFPFQGLYTCTLDIGAGIFYTCIKSFRTSVPQTGHRLKFFMMVT